MKMRKILCVLFMISIIFISGTVSAILVYNSDDKKLYNCDQNPTANWTIMYYICGESNIDYYVDFLLENLSSLGSDNDLNIVCLVDKVNYGNSKLIYINEAGEEENLNDIYGWPEEVDTSNLNTLELFCTQMMLNYPAKYYGLIVFASGGCGWQEYYIGDKDGSGITKLPDFANTLKNATDKTGKKIDVLIGSCAVNMIEVAYELNPAVNYLVGTQDCFPHSHVIHLFFDAVEELKNNTGLSPEDFAIQGPIKFKPLSFIYWEGYGKGISLLSKILNKLPFPKLHSVYHHPNCAAINITEIVNLTQAFDELASLLLLNIHDKDIYEAIKKSRVQVAELGRCAPKISFLFKFYDRNPFEFLAWDCYIDMYDIVRLFKENIPNSHIKSKCDEVLEKINQTISYNAKNQNISNCGISIYFPDSKFMYNKYRLGGKIPYKYEEIKFSKDTLWDEFLKEYLYKKFT